VPAAVALIYIAAATLGGIGLAVSRMDRPIAYIVAGIVAALGLFFGVLLARVPVYDERFVRSPRVVPVFSSRGRHTRLRRVDVEASLPVPTGNGDVDRSGVIDGA
jgi:hypothetical protein